MPTFSHSQASGALPASAREQSRRLAPLASPVGRAPKLPLSSTISKETGECPPVPVFPEIFPTATGDDEDNHLQIKERDPQSKKPKKTSHKPSSPEEILEDLEDLADRVTKHHTTTTAMQSMLVT